MIPGFEDYTVDVTDSEKEIIEVISESLKKRIGKENAITNKEMRIRIYNWNGIKITGAKMRKYIQYIRANNMVTWLCASSKGYHIARNHEEWLKYREGFRTRVRSMQFTLACMDMDNAIKRVTNK